MKLGKRGQETFGKSFNKKGQVTIFIILGIIIIMIAFTLSYLNNENFRENFRGIAFKSIVVPEQAQGVTNYVSGCIEDIAREGIELIGMQGGYVELPNYISNNPELYLNVAGLKIPYWLYGEDSITEIPELEDIETDLENYIVERMNSECNLESYKEQGYVFSGDYDVLIDINEKNVNIVLDSKFGVTIKGDSYDLSKYVSVSISKKLGMLYEMAKKIINRELKNAPLEFNTLNLLTIYSRHSSKEIPPMAGMEFDCGSKKWLIPNVKTVFKNIVEENSVKLRIQGSNYVPFEDEFYETMVLDLDKNYPEVTPKFSYSTDWPFYLDISPKDGISVEANTLKLMNIPILPLFCIKSYDFKYDIKYPLLVELSDEDNDFNFRYVIEVNIKDNYGRQRAFNIDIPKEIDSLVCDEGQKLSGEVYIDTWDSLTNDPLNDVDVVFNCVEHYCSMGKTSSIDSGISSYTSKFPLCKEGELVLSKDGYLPYRENLETYTPGLSPSYSVSAYLEPLRAKNAIIKVYDVINGRLIGRPLNSDETVIVQLNRYNDIFGDYDYRTAIVFENGADRQEFEAVPAVGASIYQIQVSLISNKNIHIPEYNLGGGVTVPAFDLGGGTIIGSSNYEWILPANGEQGLDDNNVITFYVLSNGIPRNYEELQNGLDMTEENEEFYDQILPTLKNE